MEATALSEHLTRKMMSSGSLLRQMKFYIQSAWKSQFFSGMMMPIMQFVGNLGYVMVALLGGVFVIKKVLRLVISSPSSSTSVTLHSQSSRSHRLQTCYSPQQQLPNEYLNSWRSRKRVRMRRTL